MAAQMLSLPLKVDTRDFEVQCRHKDYFGETLSFAELALGAPDNKIGKGSKNWGGGFRGRPVLARQLLPILSELYGATKPAHFNSRLSSFRTFWRFLDTLDEAGGLLQVNELADIGIAHGVLWARKQVPAYSSYFGVRQAIELAREHHGMSPLVWPSTQMPKAKVSEVATPEQVQKIYIFLKHRVYETFAWWREADSLALKGRNLLLVPVEDRPTSSVTAADLHATYRALIAKTGNPVPSTADLFHELGYEAMSKGGGIRGISTIYKNSGTGIRKLLDGLYPSSRSLQNMFYLFLIQTGWNPQVLLDINPSDSNWAVPIGNLDSDIYRISSFKVRSGTWQRTISRGKPSHNPYQLIRRLWERTAPLRAASNSGQIRSSSKRIVSRSPWIFPVYNAEMGVSALDEQSYNGGDYLRELCKEINQTTCTKKLTEVKECPAVEMGSAFVPEDMKASDFRDVFIGNEFLQSGFNFVVAMFAANHASMRTTRRYLRDRSYRNYGEGELKKLMNHLWDETETRRTVDPAILRALCERGVISEPQRERWQNGKDRTYLGMGCINPKAPPPAIDPTNNGSGICRNQHLCVLCHLGIVFPDSLRDLTKRLAEVKTLRGKMPMSSWLRASVLQAELEGLTGTIAQFDTAEAISLERFWLEEIREGRHTIIEWEGVHGSP